MLVQLDLESITEQIRFLCDQRSGDFADNNVIRPLIKTAYDYLYGQIVESDENYFLKQVTLTAGEDASIRMPNDLNRIKLLKIDYLDFNKIVYPQKINTIDEHYDDDTVLRYRGTLGYDGNFIYTILQDFLQVYPVIEAKNRTYYLSYIPDPIQDVDGALFLPAGSEHFIKYYVASDVLLAESVDNRYIDQKRMEWERRVMQSVKKRNSDFNFRSTPSKHSKKRWIYG